jgi:hypothetical protein
LNGEIFYSLREAQVVIEKWRAVCKTLRPHSALGDMPHAPTAFAPQMTAIRSATVPCEPPFAHWPDEVVMQTLSFAAVQKLGLVPIEQPDAPTSGLTRQVQPLPAQIERWMTGKEIATKLFLSEQTVKNSVYRILATVGVGGRLGVIEAYQPSRWVCSSAKNTVTNIMSAQLCFGALPRRVPCLIDGRNTRVYRGLQ